MTAAQILLAASRPAYQRIFAILTGHRLRFVTTMAEAQAALAGDPFDVVIIGTCFDESRMFDLLNEVRADGRHASVPVICFRGVVEASTPFNREAVEAACNSIGANAFFDLCESPDDAAGNAAVRNIVSEVLGRHLSAHPGVTAMRLVEKIEYRGHTLLRFEHRFPANRESRASHWLVIGPDGINVMGSRLPTEADARACVDRHVACQSDS